MQLEFGQKFRNADKLVGKTKEGLRLWKMGGYTRHGHDTSEGLLLINLVWYFKALLSTCLA